MKLADIEHPITPEALHHYKMMNKLGMMEVSVATNIPNVVEMVHKCINELKVKNCTEFAINKIEYHYYIMEDEHEWRISLLGFMRLN